MTNNNLYKRSEVGCELEAYWRSLFKNGKCPSYEAFDALEIGNLVPLMLILKIERRHPLKTTAMLMGSTLVDRTGFDITGMDLLEFVDQKHVHLYEDRFAAAIDQPCALIQYSQVEYLNAENALVETTTLPFTDKSGAVSYLINVGERIEFTSAVSRGQEVNIGETEVFEFLDIGFGVPMANFKA